MARTEFLILVLTSSTLSLTTCPGFPGFCSETFPGTSCQVVCAAGRNNVPLCQEDGTWTDIPRCIEHEPGVEEQIPGLCPGVSGYCSTGFLHNRCRFDCTKGSDIDSVCTADGTWSPYPTCQGDVRDLRDGCDGCPGPQGGLRNRTAERILNVNVVSDRRVPKRINNDGGRKQVPSFAGNVRFGPLESRQENSASRTPQQQQNNVQQQNFRQQQQFPRQNIRQQQNTRQQFPQQNPRQQFPQQNNRQQFPQQNPRQQFPQQNTRQQFPEQNTRQQQQPPRQNSLFADQFPQNSQQQPRQQQQQPQQSSPSSLFDQIKSRIQANSNEAQQPRQLFQPQVAVERPRQPQAAVPRPRQQTGGPDQTFGVFESVNLSSSLGGPSPPASGRQQSRQQKQRGDGFFGVFQNVELQE